MQGRRGTTPDLLLLLLPLCSQQHTSHVFLVVQDPLDHVPSQPGLLHACPLALNFGLHIIHTLLELVPGGLLRQRSQG